MFISAPPRPDPNAPTTPGQKWLLRKQTAIAEQVGEPVFITLKIVYGGWFHVILNTPEGYEGMSMGYDLEETLRVLSENRW